MITPSTRLQPYKVGAFWATGHAVKLTHKPIHLMNIKLPTVNDILNRKNWTGHTLEELVSFGRVTPKEGADIWIQSIQNEQFHAGYRIPSDKVGEYVKIWDQLEYEVLDRLVEIRAQS